MSEQIGTFGSIFKFLSGVTFSGTSVVIILVSFTFALGFLLYLGFNRLLTELRYQRNVTVQEFASLSNSTREVVKNLKNLKDSLALQNEFHNLHPEPDDDNTYYIEDEEAEEVEDEDLEEEEEEDEETTEGSEEEQGEEEENYLYPITEEEEEEEEENEIVED